jgi:hypothetical protein
MFQHLHPAILRLKYNLLHQVHPQGS